MVVYVQWHFPNSYIIRSKRGAGEYLVVAMGWAVTDKERDTLPPPPGESFHHLILNRYINVPGFHVTAGVLPKWSRRIEKVTHTQAHLFDVCLFRFFLLYRRVVVIQETRFTSSFIWGSSQSLCWLLLYIVHSTSTKFGFIWLLLLFFLLFLFLGAFAHVNLCIH